MTPHKKNLSPKLIAPRRDDSLKKLSEIDSLRQATERSEFAVRTVGVMMAVGSVAFAASMISDTSHQPQFAGAEYLSIFTKPKSQLAARERQMAQQQFAQKKPVEVDYTPVGAIPRKGTKSIASDFELLEASTDIALVRGSSATVWVSQGDVIAGLGKVKAIERRGDRWALVTEGGVIMSK